MPENTQLDVKRKWGENCEGGDSSPCTSDMLTNIYSTVLLGRANTVPTSTLQS